MTNFRALMLGTVAAGLAVSTISTDAKADPTMISSGTDKTELQIKGHVNRAVLYADNDNDEDVFFVDNGASESRMTITGKGKITEDLSAKAVIEMRFESNRSDAVNFENARTVTSSADRGVGIRHTYLTFESKKFGAITTGQASDAADGAFGVDLSGTALSGAYADGPDDVGNALEWSANGENSDKTLGGGWLSGDGTRTDLIKYDSPSFGGARLHASVAQGGWNIISGSYSGEFFNTKVAGAVGWSNSTGSEGQGVSSAVKRHAVGSLSALHASGLNATFAFTVVDEMDTSAPRDDEPVTFYGKLGYRADLVDIGESAFSISYGNSQDALTDGSEQDVYQFGFVQKVDAAATELYLSINFAEFEDDTNTNYDDMIWSLAGARVKF